MSPWFVLIPLMVYVPMFSYEIYIAFRRIGKPKDRGGEYLHATWESTHTFLILGVNYFVWLYSAAVVTVGRAVFIPLLVFGAAFVVRAILYIQLFYLRSSPKPNVTIDRLFAWAHVAMAGCLAVIVYRALKIMLSNDYTANHLLLPLLLPGLLLLVPLISVPLYFLYKTKTT